MSLTEDKLLTELHCHSTYSNGDKIKFEGLSTPMELLARAETLGINVLALTDHNTIKGSIEAKKLAGKFNINVLLGEEIDTLEGHVLAVGIQEEIKRDLSFFETIDLIHEQGGIAIAAHPFDLANKGVKELARKTDAMEAFNAINLDRISNWNAKNFAKKFKLNVTAGSDAHASFMLGHGLNLIKAENDIDSILKAIRKGRNELKTKYMPVELMQYWSLKRLQHSYFELLDYIYTNYSLPKRVIASKLLSLVKKSPGRIDYFFKGLAYFALGSATAYSAVKTVGKKIKELDK